MKNKLLITLSFITWTFSAFVAFLFLFYANVPFWYDPARDMLSAWANLHKLTLIGPTSGIPGFFYGPYWIWWLSFGLLFSKNPVIVTAITMTIPYLVIFFGVLLLFSKLFGRLVSIILWLLFFITFQGYLTQIWNPYLSPVFFLSIIYIMVFHVKKINKISSAIPIFISGLLTGIALNLHISFSIGFSLGCIIFLLFQSFLVNNQTRKVYNLKQSSLLILSFILGILVAFIPFFIFEIRHGFEQSKIALNAFLSGGAVVSLHGLSKQEILMHTFLPFSQIIHIPFFISLAIFIILFGLYVYYLLKQKIFSEKERNLIVLLCSIFISTLTLYLLAKNPIWEYHFYGFEVLWLLLLGLFTSKIKFIKYILFIWTMFICIFWTGNFINSLQIKPLSRGSLFTKEYIVNIIQKDAKGKDFTVYAYSPSIYTYEYNYLFRWITGKEFSYDPAQIQKRGNVYLILPPGDQAKIADFVQFRTPSNFYKTTKIWDIPDGTKILKRVKF